MNISSDTMLPFCQHPYLWQLPALLGKSGEGVGPWAWPEMIQQVNDEPGNSLCFWLIQFW